MIDLIDHQTMSLPDQARWRILELIEEKKLRPGDSVSHRQLAEELGMSTLSVGSALRSLEQDGLIVSRSRSGSSIAVITPGDVWNMVQHRLALELRAARIACQMASDEELAALQSYVAAADGEGITSLNDWTEADDRFHHFLMSCSHTPGLMFQPHYLRIFRVKLDMCAGLQLGHNFRSDGSLVGAYGHEMIAELAVRRNAEELMAVLELHVCGAIGIPELESLEHISRADKREEVRTLLDSYLESIHSGLRRFRK